MYTVLFRGCSCRVLMKCGKCCRTSHTQKSCWWSHSVLTWRSANLEFLALFLCFSTDTNATLDFSCLSWETRYDLGLDARNWPGYTEAEIKLYMRNKKITSRPILNIEVTLLCTDDKMDKGEKEVSVIQWGQQRTPKAEQCFHCFNTSAASPLKDPNDKDTEGFFLFAVCFPSNKYTSCSVRIPSFSLFIFF